MDDNSRKKMLTQAEAAERLGLKPATLARWRWSGQGPLHRKLGAAVRYHIDDIEAFIAAGTRTSTSSNGSAHSGSVREQRGLK